MGRNKKASSATSSDGQFESGPKNGLHVGGCDVIREKKRGKTTPEAGASDSLDPVKEERIGGVSFSTLSKRWLILLLVSLSGAICAWVVGRFRNEDSVNGQNIGIVNADDFSGFHSTISRGNGTKTAKIPILNTPDLERNLAKLIDYDIHRPAFRFKKGDKVWFFMEEYRDEQGWNQLSQMAVFDSVQGTYGPRFGLSEGWIAAVVMDVHSPFSRDENRTGSSSDEEKFAPGSHPSHYTIAHAWDHWVDAQGRLAAPSHALVAESNRLRARDEGEQLDCRTFSRAGCSSYRPLISLITLRWGEREVPSSNEEQLIATNPMYLYELIDHGFRPLVNRNYEIWTIFLRRYQDCENVARSLHLWLPRNHPARRAQFVASFTNMVPTGWDTGSYGSAFESGPKSHSWTAPFYEAGPFYRMLQAFERQGVIPAFPHPARLYDILAGKAWTYMLGLDNLMNIPPTVVVPREAILRDPRRAASEARITLTRHKEQLFGNEALDIALHPRGVIKVGYSWEAQDVRLFSWDSRTFGCSHALFEMAQESVMVNDPHNGVQSSEEEPSLEESISWMGETGGVSSPGNRHLSQDGLDAIVSSKNDKEALRLTAISVRGNNIEGKLGRRFGGSHFVNEIMLQEFIPHNLELRLYYFENQPRMHWWTRYLKHEGSRVKSFKYMDDTAASRFVNGDMEALQRIVQEAQKMGERWLLWIRSMTGLLTVPGIRIDFFVQYWHREKVLPSAHDLASYVLPECPWSDVGEEVLKSKSPENEWTGYDAYSYDDDTTSPPISPQPIVLNKSEVQARNILQKQESLRKREAPKSYTWKRRNEARFKLWTMELTELGFSMFGNRKVKELAMQSIVRNILMS